MLGDAQPEPEQGSRADHVVVGDDAQSAPAVDHGKQREMVVGQGRGRRAAVLGLAEAELVEHVVAEERLALPLGASLGAEDLFLGGVNAGAELVGAALQHEVEQLGGGLGELGDLLVGFGVEDGEAGVDVPLLGVDAEHEVDLDVFDAADITGSLPGELLGCVPGLAHAEESSVGDGLGIGRDAVMFLGTQVDNLGVEAGEYMLDLGERFIGGAMLDEHQRLALGIDIGAVEGMAGYDVNVGGQVLLEGLDLGIFTGRLAANNGAELGR